MPIDSDEALQRATLVRSDPSLVGVSRRNIAKEDNQYLWEYVAPNGETIDCLLYTSPSPRDLSTSRMPSSA